MLIMPHGDVVENISTVFHWFKRAYLKLVLLCAKHCVKEQPYIELLLYKGEQ